MRNLKRVLALAMAMVMILGMMVIGSSAASYSDAAAIDADYAEAVEVLTGLGVFEGTGTGFAPKQILDRASAAALVYRVITGDVKNKQTDLYDFSSFADVKEGVWYTPYITYAANGGYIKGYNGNAMPNDTVTGIQVLAMMLRAAGYGQNGEFEGAAWKDNILTTAKDLGITAGISTNDLDKGASRELVAQLIFNAISKVKMVAYSSMLNKYVAVTVTNNDGKVGIGFTQTLGEKVFSLAKVEGVITDTTYATGETKIGAITLKGTDGDWTKVGYAARAWYVDGKKADTALSIVITGEDLSVTTDGTTLAAMNNKKLPTYVADLNTGDDKVVDAKDVLYVVNGEVATKSDIVTGVGAKVALVDNDKDGDIDAVVNAVYTVATVDLVQERSTSGKITTEYYQLSNDEVIYPDELVGVEALEEYDYVTYIAIDADNDDKDNNAWSHYYVNVCEADIAELEDIDWEELANGSEVKAYTLGGESYIASALSAAANYADLKNSNIDENIEYVLDEYGYIIYASKYEDPKAYLFVLANEDSHGISELSETEVVYTDGTIDTITVINGKGVEVKDDELAKEIYSYTAKGSNYMLKDQNAKHLTDIAYATDEITMGDYGLTKKTVVVDLRDVIAGKADEGTVYTGWNEIPSVLDGELYALVKNGNITLAFLVDGVAPSSKAASFVVFDTTTNKEDYVGKDAEGNRMYTYTLKKGVLIKGELVEDYVLSEAQKADINTYGVGVYSYDKYGDLTYTSFAEDDVNWTPYSNGMLIKGNKDITDDYTVKILNIAKGKVDDWDLLVEPGTYYANFDEKNEVLYIVGNDVVGSDILADADDKGVTTVTTETKIYTVADKNVTDVEAVKVPDTWTITVKNYAVGTEYAINGKLNAGSIEVVDGTYMLDVKATAGYTGAVVVVGDDANELEVAEGFDSSYAVKVDGKDVIVEIHGAADINEYVVSFDTHTNLSVAAKTITVKSTAADCALPELTVEGWDFLGWYTAANGGEKVADLTAYKGLAGSTTLHAQWSPKTNTVTFNYYVDGTLLVDSIQYVQIKSNETKDVFLGSATDKVYFVGNDAYDSTMEYTLTGITKDVTIKVDVELKDACTKINVTENMADWDIEAPAYVKNTDALKLYLVPAEGNTSALPATLKCAVDYNGIHIDIDAFVDATTGQIGGSFMQFSGATLTFSV